MLATNRLSDAWGTSGGISGFSWKILRIFTHLHIFTHLSLKSSFYLQIHPVLVLRRDPDSTSAVIGLQDCFRTAQWPSISWFLCLRNEWSCMETTQMSLYLYAMPPHPRYVVNVRKTGCFLPFFCFVNSSEWRMLCLSLRWKLQVRNSNLVHVLQKSVCTASAVLEVFQTYHVMRRTLLCCIRKYSDQINEKRGCKPATRWQLKLLKGDAV